MLGNDNEMKVDDTSELVPAKKIKLSNDAEDQMEIDIVVENKKENIDFEKSQTEKSKDESEQQCDKIDYESEEEKKTEKEEFPEDKKDEKTTIKAEEYLSDDENVDVNGMDTDEPASSDIVPEVAPDLQNEVMGSLPDLLKQYYGRFFPYSDYYRWLSYGNVDENYYCNREFSFTLKDDIYIRYMSFTTLKELKDGLKAKCPYKIDIGAVYNAKPNTHKSIKSSAFKPLEKELVFDIDMTDYDDIRECCSGAKICELCWPFMQAAMEVMDASLKQDFGFQHRLWVYSGRRGVHCWVCDARARKLSTEQRSSLCEYLTIVTGSDQIAKKVNITGPHMHPMVARSVEILEPYFESIVLKSQKLLQYPKHIDTMLACIPDQKIASQLKQEWSNQEYDENSPGSVSMHRWNQMKNLILKKKKEKTGRAFTHCKGEIILQFTYPRLDINVSRQTNHLLKSPFSVHPKTGRVCVPISQENIKGFNPFTVPTLNDLLREMNIYMQNKEGEEDDENEETRNKIADYKKTSLKEHVAVFKGFVDNLQIDNQAQRKEKVTTTF